MHTPRTVHLSEQAFRVLRRLRGLYSPRNPFVSADWLAIDTQMPDASLRRTIAELRSAGYSVVHDRGRVGLMYLGEPSLMQRQFITWSQGLGRVYR